MAKHNKIQILYAVMLAIFSLLADFLVELSYFQLDVLRTLEWILNSWQLFLGSSTVIAAAMLLLLCCSSHIGISIMIPFFIVVILGCVNGIKISYRGTPLYPDELKLISNLSEMSKMISRPQLLLMVGVIILFLLCVTLGLIFIRRFKLKPINRILLGYLSLFIVAMPFFYNYSFVLTRKVLASIFIVILLFTVVLYCRNLILKLKRPLITVPAFFVVLLLAGIRLHILPSFAIVIIALALSAIYALTITRCKDFIAISKCNFIKLAAVLSVSLVCVTLYRTGHNPFYSFVKQFSEYPEGHFAGEHYETNSVLLAFMKGANNASVMIKPEGYSPELVADIVAEYREKADSVNQLRIPEEEKPNIVYVMSEAFSDPTVFSEFHYSDDPMSYTRLLQSYLPAGNALVTVYGGGTILPEFEALTGFSTQNMNSVDVYGMVGRRNQFPSIVSILEERNYKTTFIHPNDRTFYRRDIAFNVMGFDEFIDRDTMQYQGSVDGYRISDSACFEQTLNVLNRNDDPQFVCLVTFQNHGPYPLNNFPDDGETVDSNFPDEVMIPLNTYARGIRISEQAMHQFLFSIQLQARPTIVVFWGDHRPVGYPIDFFMEYGYAREQYETPMFFFANFELEGKNLGSVSPVFFQSILFDLLEMPATPLHIMLNEVHEKVNGVHGDWFIDSNNQMKIIEEMDDETIQLLNKYRVIQYDVTCGEQQSILMGFFS